MEHFKRLVYGLALLSTVAICVWALPEIVIGLVSLGFVIGILYVIGMVVEDFFEEVL